VEETNLKILGFRTLLVAVVFAAAAAVVVVADPSSYDFPCSHCNCSSRKQVWQKPREKMQMRNKSVVLKDLTLVELAGIFAA
jgi:hypothetical protein